MKSVLKAKTNKRIGYAKALLLFACFGFWIITLIGLENKSWAAELPKAAATEASKPNHHRRTDFEERVDGFKAFHRSLEKFEKERMSDLDAHLKSKKDREQAQQKAFAEYMKENAKKKKIDMESTPAYEDYLLKKWQWKNDPEKKKAQDQYIKNRDKRASTEAEKKFEIEEYALNLSEDQRVPFNKRKLFVTTGGSKHSGGSSSSGGGFDGGGSPYSPPPSFDNDLPDFDDNNVPPPPPPPPPDFGPGGNFMDPGGEFIPPPPPPPPFGGGF